MAWLHPAAIILPSPSRHPAASWRPVCCRPLLWRPPSWSDGIPMAWRHPVAFYPLGILPPIGALYTAAPSSGARPHGLAASPWIGGILQPLSSLTRPASCRPRWMSATLPMRPPPLPYRTHHISFIRFISHICHISHIRFIRHIRLIHHINNILTNWWRPLRVPAVLPCVPAARTPFRPECPAHAPSPAPSRHARPSVPRTPAHAPSPAPLRHAPLAYVHKQ